MENTIDHVTNRVVFLKALRDAISVHRDAFTSKKILHRNVSASNIVYTDYFRYGRGLYGRLVGFEDSIQAGEDSGLKLYKSSLTFQSINVLRNSDAANPRQWRQPHDYLDDLESFFWVFIWTTASQLPPKSGQSRPLSPPPALLSEMEHSFHKELMVQRCENGRAYLIFDEEWGPEIIDLAAKLATFFIEKLDGKRHCWKEPKQFDFEASMGDALICYAKVIGLFNAAISELESPIPLKGVDM